MPPCTLRDPSLWLKLDQGVLRTRTRSFRAPKRGGPCFLLVPQQRARPPGKESSGWLRGWDRSIKCTNDAPSTNLDANLRASDVSDRLNDDGASAHSPQGEVTPSTHATRKRKKVGSSAGRSAGRSHHDPRSDLSSADKLLREAGGLSWKSRKVNLEVRRGKQRRLTRLGLKAPRRRQVAVKTGKGRMYLTTAGGEDGGVKEDKAACYNAAQEGSNLEPSRQVTPSGQVGKQRGKTGTPDTKPRLRGDTVTKIAVKATQADGSVLLIRKRGRGSKAHAGEWQLPSLKVLHSPGFPTHTLQCMSRGLLRARPPEGEQLTWDASTFVCGKGLGQPVLVLVFETEVVETDVVPARAELKPEEVMWVSASQYESMIPGISEVLLKRCPWQLKTNSRFTARRRLTSAAHDDNVLCEEERRGLWNHDFVSVAFPNYKDVLLFEHFHKTSFLHVVSTAVWDSTNKKVLIASRRQAIVAQRKRSKADSKRSLLQYDKTDKYGNKSKYETRWEFPGGKVEVGETNVDAAVRELKEELDVGVRREDIRVASFQTYPWFGRHLVRTLFTVQQFTGKVCSLEMQNFKWVGLDELKSYNLMNGDIPFADWIIAHYKD